MKPWEIWTADVGHGPHPVIIVSNPTRVTLKPEVVVLTCSSQRCQRGPREHEVVLDEADGLEWPMLRIESSAFQLVFATHRSEQSAMTCKVKVENGTIRLPSSLNLP